MTSRWQQSTGTGIMENLCILSARNPAAFSLFRGTGCGTSGGQSTGRTCRIDDPHEVALEHGNNVTVRSEPVFHHKEFDFPGAN